MAKIMIGGIEYTGDLDVFARLELAWPYMNDIATAARDLKGTEAAMKQSSAMAGLVAVAISKPLDWVKANLRRDEVPGLRVFYMDLMEESGATMGEAVPAEGEEAASPSTETSTQSSPS